jgi:hypothetical protein
MMDYRRPRLLGGLQVTRLYRHSSGIGSWGPAYESRLIPAYEDRFMRAYRDRLITRDRSGVVV